MRPDLPMIVVVIAAGLALALFADGAPAPVERTAAEARGTATDDVVENFIGELGPVSLDCFGDIAPSEAKDSDPADDLEAVVRQVSGRVERLRDLEFATGVDARFLDAERLRGRVEGLIAEELKPEQIRREGELLSELGAIPPGSDLEEIATEALGSQVIGLYDTKSKQLLVQSGDELGAEELITLAHELQHALSDQALGIDEPLGGPRQTDRALAYAATIEGDATLTMELYALAHIGLAEQLSLRESVPGEDQFAALPDYVQRSLLFPYLGGLNLVCARYAVGGWRAVDRLYERPPRTTAEVLFPGLYPAGPAPALDGLRSPGPGWEPVIRRDLGAAELEWLFRAPGGDPGTGLAAARNLAGGLAAGEVALWRREGERALVISLLERARSDSLCGALAEWYRASRPETTGGATTGHVGGIVVFGFAEPGRFAALYCAGSRVRLGVAPDPATALGLVE